LPAALRETQENLLEEFERKEKVEVAGTEQAVGSIVKLDQRFHGITPRAGSLQFAWRTLWMVQIKLWVGLWQKHKDLLV
jgi:hypothetical protein